MSLLYEHLTTMPGTIISFVSQIKKKMEVHFWSFLIIQNVFKIQTQAKLTIYYFLMKYPEETVKK